MPNEYKYAVIMTYTFDIDSYIDFFKTEAEAKEFLKEEVEKEYQEELINGISSSTYDISADGWYGYVKSGADDGDEPAKTEYTICNQLIFH